LSFPEKYARDNLVSTEQSAAFALSFWMGKNVSSPLVPGLEALIVRAAGARDISARTSKSKQLSYLARIIHGGVGFWEVSGD
jgi:hypothetical protein